MSFKFILIPTSTNFAKLKRLSWTIKKYFNIYSRKYSCICHKRYLSSQPCTNSQVLLSPYIVSSEKIYLHNSMEDAEMGCL